MNRVCRSRPNRSDAHASPTRGPLLVDEGDASRAEKSHPVRYRVFCQRQRPLRDGSIYLAGDEGHAGALQRSSEIVTAMFAAQVQ